MDHDTATKDTNDASIPSCESCRRRKLKCGRQQPTCSTCGNFQVECIYNFDKKKPGLKVGAVESLSRRLEVVEAVLSRQQPSPHSLEDLGSDRRVAEDTSQHASTPCHAILSLLTTQLHELTNAITASQSLPTDNQNVDNTSFSSSPSRKRRRTGSGDRSFTQTEPWDYMNEAMKDRQEGLVLDAYFHRIQPWLSVIHEPSFRRQFQTRRSSWSGNIVFQAMIVATIPQMNQVPDLWMNTNTGASQTVMEVRRTVVSTALDVTSIEHIQALIILTYADIVDGNIQRAMVMLGTIHRCLGVLGIHRERVTENRRVDEDESFQKAPKPDWISEEEERRLVWNAQILDRFCSTFTGGDERIRTNPPLRRLPACASFWYTNREISTPFFRYHDTVGSDLQATHRQLRMETLQSHELPLDPFTWKGSLAFFIETVESMGVILDHINQRVTYSDREDVSRWLKRFRDVDERLMRWKSELPQQWADSGISRYALSGVMDPVMTEANALHNTNVLLLHEHIAYPEPGLRYVQLPNVQSAKICRTAALEVCSIVRKFLQQRKDDYPLGPYFAVCAFTSARNLLMYSQEYGSLIDQEFWYLVEALDLMARRVRSFHSRDYGSIDLFSRFSRRLRTFHARSQVDPTYRIDISEPLLDFMVRDTETRERHWLTPEALINMLEASRKDIISRRIDEDQRAPAEEARGPLHDSATGSSTRANREFVLPSKITEYHPQQLSGASQEQHISDISLHDDNLVSISQSLIDPDFTNLDRVLNFDEFLFIGSSDESTAWNVS